jgi:hypothetical protein
MQQLNRLPGDIRSIAQRMISLLAREQYPPRAKELTTIQVTIAYGYPEIIG